ncbi:hypothetical protein ACF0H5_012514 [Mactra antiquata]
MTFRSDCLKLYMGLSCVSLILIYLYGKLDYPAEGIQSLKLKMSEDKIMERQMTANHRLHAVDGTTNGTSTLHDNDMKIKGDLLTKSDDQMSRQSIIKSTCELFPELKSLEWQVHGRYFPCHRFYYCGVAKLGTTFLNAFFNRALQCRARNVGRFLLKSFVEHTLTFMNTGDPYERLFSAYINKLYKPDMEFWNIIGEDVVKHVRKDYNKDDGYDVTFKELVEYIVLYHDAGNKLNTHLTPIHQICNPCGTRFNYIGKKETLSADILNLFEIMKTKGDIKVDIPVTEIEREIRSFAGTEGTVYKLKSAIKRYPSIPPYRFLLRHWSYYQIRGYILNEFEMPLSESEAENMSKMKYYDLLTTAINSSSINREQLKLQRKEALLEAYKSIPLELMLRLSEFMKIDCLLFGYDVKPSTLFNRDTPTGPIKHIYMKGL